MNKITKQLEAIVVDMRAISDSRLAEKLNRKTLMKSRDALKSARPSCATTAQQLIDGAIGLIGYMVEPIGVGIVPLQCHAARLLVELAANVERRKG